MPAFPTALDITISSAYLADAGVAEDEIVIAAGTTSVRIGDVVTMMRNHRVGTWRQGCGGTTGVTAELKEFIAAKFGSADQIDVFVFLYRNRSREWTPAEVASELGSAPEAAGMRLYLLATAGLLESKGSQAVTYRFTTNPVVETFAAAISEMHQQDPAAVYAMIGGGSPNDPVKHLADAFRLRK